MLLPGFKVTQPVRRRRVRSGLPTALVALFAFVFALTFAPQSHAYSWMIRHGYTACSTCHADPSGGELLTQYGRATSDLLLSMQYGPPKTENPEPGMLWGAVKLPEWLLLSGSYRSLSILMPGIASENGTTTTFRFVPVMQGDLYAQAVFGFFKVGGSLGIASARPGSTIGRAAQVTTNDEGMNLISRTHYVGFDIGDSYTLRVGRLNLPFGIRSPEHTLWARQATRTDRESAQQHGVAIAYVGEKLRGEFLAIAGNYQTGPDDIRERGYSMYLEAAASERLATGFSSKVTYAAVDRFTFEKESLRQVHGLFARWSPLTALVFLAEVDALFRTNADAGYTGFVQADYEPIQGLHFLLTGEFLDEGLPISAIAPTASAGLGEPRFGGWLGIDYFFYRQMEVRVDAIARQNDPLMLLAQLHFYL